MDSNGIVQDTNRASGPRQAVDNLFSVFLARLTLGRDGVWAGTVSDTVFFRKGDHKMGADVLDLVVRLERRLKVDFRRVQWPDAPVTFGQFLEIIKHHRDDLNRSMNVSERPILCRMTDEEIWKAICEETENVLMRNDINLSKEDVLDSWLS